MLSNISYTIIPSQFYSGKCILMKWKSLYPVFIYWKMKYLDEHKKHGDKMLFHVGTLNGGASNYTLSLYNLYLIYKLNDKNEKYW